MFLFPCYFYYFSFCLIFVSLINIHVGVFLLSFILCEILHILDLINYFFSHIGNHFDYSIIKYFLRHFSFFFLHACLLGHFSFGQPFTTLQTVAHQALLSMGLSRQEYWSNLPFPPPNNLPNPGTGPMFLVSPALAGGFFTTITTWEAPDFWDPY